MVKSAVDGAVVGIMSERDFVKALATDTTHECSVGDLMTPVSKMVTVSLNTGVGGVYPSCHPIEAAIEERYILKVRPFDHRPRRMYGTHAEAWYPPPARHGHWRGR